MDTVDLALRARDRVLNLRNRALGRIDLTGLEGQGLVHGKRTHLGPGAMIDWDFAWLIELGDDVTMAPNVSVIAHDASTKIHTGYTRIAPVRIGSRVFVGAKSTILPGVTIGDDVIIGAGSLVTKDVPSGSVAVGSPAQVVGTTEDYLASREAKRAEVRTFDKPPHRVPGFTAAQAAELRSTLGREGAYVP